MFDSIKNWLQLQGVSENLLVQSSYLTAIVIIVSLSIAANIVAKRFMLKGLRVLITKSKNQWDDIFLRDKVFHRLSHLAPALVIFLGSSILFNRPGQAQLVDYIQRGSLIYMYIVGAMFFSAVLRSIGNIYQRFEFAKTRPIKGYLQAIKISLFLLMLILVVSTVIAESPKLLLSGIGALTAVLILVFRDTILGFVAGIQLTSNKMVRQGDWITVPKANADGDVIDVSLTTVTVQNWDMTITAVPIYHLISDAFTNWRGMSESGGRRIKRCLHIDLNTIGFCDQEMLDRFQNIKLLQEYIQTTTAEIENDRKRAGVPEQDRVNGRRLTNIGVFRRYISAYLKSHPQIHQEMTLLVRQLQPGETGLPLEIYVFSKDQRWVFYENIQSDIFDHLLAILPEFGLKVYQRPSSGDFQYLAGAMEGKAPQTIPGG